MLHSSKIQYCYWWVWCQLGYFLYKEPNFLHLETFVTSSLILHPTISQVFWTFRVMYFCVNFSVWEGWLIMLVLTVFCCFNFWGWVQIASWLFNPLWLPWCPIFKNFLDLFYVLAHVLSWWMYYCTWKEVVGWCIV